MASGRAVSTIDYGALAPGCHRLRFAVASLPDGTTLTIAVTVLVGSRPRPRLAAIGGVHGNEYPGPLAILELARDLRPETLKGTVVLVPFANPLAYNAGSRVSPEDGVNLNRVFPGSAAGTLTHRMADALVTGIIQDADLAIDLHSAEATGEMMPMAGFRERGDDIARRSARAAAAFRLEMNWMMRWAPGTLSTALNERGVAAVGCEIGGGGVAASTDVALYRQGIERCLRFLGIHGDPLSVEPPNTVEVMDDIVAPVSGLIVDRADLRAPVRIGQVVATIRDTWGETVAELRSPWDGRVVHVRHFRQVRAGETVMSIGRPEPHPAR
jgi:predicted deacylase